MLGVDSSRRVLSGMRSTGTLHLGHLHGAIGNWVQLQKEYECFFLVADLHGFSTQYETPNSIANSSFDMVMDWLAAGINPNNPIFLQSQVPQHAELFLLLSMITPLSWLERLPAYRDHNETLQDKELSTYGFLGYPVLQAADALLYRAGLIPVGQDQVPHVEVARSIARRFNYLYGREDGFEQALESAQRKLGKKVSDLYARLRKQYQEKGDVDALLAAKALVKEQSNITISDQERLLGGLDGHGRNILPEAQPLLSTHSSILGTDGRKMSKSFNNTITLRETPDNVAQKVMGMKTDPARLRRTSPGNPENCPVWSFHKLYSKQDAQEWVQHGCTSASIGCVDCKKPIIDAINEELQPVRVRAAEYEKDPGYVRQVLVDGAETAQEEAEATLDEVKEAMGLGRIY